MQPTTPRKAIRLKCLDCVNGQIYEINKCHIQKCPLWNFRTGHRNKDNVNDSELDTDN